MASSLTLVCLVAGEPLDSLFLIDIDGQQPVARLRDKIFSKNKNSFTGLNENQLTIWMLNDPLSQEDISTQGIKDVLDNRSEHATKLDKPFSKLSTYFKDPPSRDHLHLIIQKPTVNREFCNFSPKGKRRREDPVDISNRLLDKWNVPLQTVLSVANIAVYLSAPLNPEEKIPISNWEWRRLLLEDLEMPTHMCFATDLETLFTESEDETVPFLLYSLHEAIVTGPPDSSGTEDSFHAFWDCNILRLLVKCLDQPKWIRSSSQGTDTGSMRPDLGLLLHFTCLFRGEEKKPLFNGTHPRQELIEKTRWVYDPAPYVLGYYAVGADITFVAIQPGTATQAKKQVVITDIANVDLSTRRGRIRNAVIIIRLVKVLRKLEGMIPKEVDTDMFTVPLDDGKSIDFLKTKIRKTYPAEDTLRISFLQSIYGHLVAKGVPNVDHLRRSGTSHPEYGCFVELEPRGIDTGPTSVDDIKNAVISVLEALEVLHTSEPQIFHRDIRWENVMQSILDPKKWFLIDWEDAAIAPTKAAPKLRPETHAPQVFKDGHGAEVDIWGVGKLITRARLSDIPENLCSLGQRMVDGSILSAEQGLRELKSL